MGVARNLAGGVSKQLAPKIGQLAPQLTTSFVREALHRAIMGVGPLPPAEVSAATRLKEHDGDVDAAVHDVIEAHVRFAAGQGFLTNIGGLVTVAVTVPANITGLALVQCRMIACIAHLRGYDLQDPRVRNAILVTMLGEDAVTALVRKKKLPAPPMALATAPAHDSSLDAVVSAEVASELITKVAGKKLATTIGRRVPVAGGFVGLGVDAYSTWKVGRYADREWLPRATTSGRT
jgi:hypothetical protein